MTPPAEAATYWRSMHMARPADGWSVDIALSRADDVRYILTGATVGLARGYLADLGRRLACEGRLVVSVRAVEANRHVVITISGRAPERSGVHPLGLVSLLDRAVPRA